MAFDEGAYDRLLTPPEVIATNAPFIEKVWVIDEEPTTNVKHTPESSTPRAQLQPSKGHYERRVRKDATVQIAACSEFMLHHEALNLFAVDPSVNGHRSSHFRLLQDTQGQQIVVTVSNTGVSDLACACECSSAYVCTATLLRMPHQRRTGRLASDRCHTCGRSKGLETGVYI